MKKALALIIIAATLLSLFSCSEPDRKYNEGEVINAARGLISDSEKFNDMFWGAGIPYYEDDNYKNGQYYPADPLYLQKLGASTVSDIMKMASEIFSEGYLISIYSSTFSASVGDYGVASFTRYYQGTDVIMVYTDYKPLLTDEIDYYTERISVIGSEGERVKVKVPIKVTRGDISQEKEIEVYLIEEENGWRLDSPTYAVYFAE